MIPLAKEKEIQSAIMEYLALAGHFVWRNNSGGFTDQKGHYYRYGLTGSSDIIGAHGRTGQFIAIEVKRPNGKVTEAQNRFLETIKRCGGIGIVARSVSDVIEAGL